VAHEHLLAVQSLVSAWWYDYDAADFDAWARYFTPDARFRCRSDSGATEFEDFIKAELEGRDDVLAWHVEHRNGSPYPLRHFGTNIHITATAGDEVEFRSYLFCTQVVGTAVANLASGRVVGTARIDDDGTARFAELRVVLDFTDSVPFTDATPFPPA
jgi:hypothetical protein